MKLKTIGLDLVMIGNDLALAVSDVIKIGHYPTQCGPGFFIVLFLFDAIVLTVVALDIGT